MGIQGESDSQSQMKSPTNLRSEFLERISGVNTPTKMETASNISTKSQDYIKAFEVLLNRAIELQSRLQIHQIPDFDYIALHIDPLHIKSFKDLCTKLLHISESIGDAYELTACKFR